MLTITEMTMRNFDMYDEFNVVEIVLVEIDHRNGSLNCIIINL